jgi:hypothetical protein
MTTSKILSNFITHMLLQSSMLKIKFWEDMKSFQYNQTSI